MGGPQQTKIKAAAGEKKRSTFDSSFTPELGSVSTSERLVKPNACDQKAGSNSTLQTVYLIKQITRKMTDTSSWTNLFSKRTDAEAMILGAEKEIHRTALCQQISYWIRSNCHQFIGVKSQLQTAKPENIFATCMTDA
ncbi:hypothetical protein P7K49_009930 [Saguinus oedipus]|uniref:Uncharacterized protein n=1 Tax=Saguinus oedipus TaxID=9490 RepID=A0ABQ9VMS3_SAGOE|nr:hypothetical protein P7K49_009930 [Saguinus oedipus]